MFVTGQNLTFQVQGQDNTYGNNVTYRPTTLQRSARKAFIDYNFILPDSRVITFYLYAEGSLPSADNRFLYLQVWRPVDVTRLRWQLVWQQYIQLTRTTRGLYTVSTS